MNTYPRAFDVCVPLQYLLFLSIKYTFIQNVHTEYIIPFRYEWYESFYDFLYGTFNFMIIPAK